MTLQPGDRCFAAMAHPLNSPPPPHGTNRKSASPASSISCFGRRALARDDVRVIVRRDQDVAVLGGQLVRDRLTRCDLGIVDYDLGAVVARGGQFLRRRILRHDDGGMHAHDLAHQRQRLGVVARRVGDDAVRPLLIAQPADRVVCAAELEHADVQLAFEEHAVAAHRRPGRTARYDSMRFTTPRIRIAADAGMSSSVIHAPAHECRMPVPTSSRSQIEQRIWRIYRIRFVHPADSLFYPSRSEPL